MEITKDKMKEIVRLAYAEGWSDSECSDMTKSKANIEESWISSFSHEMAQDPIGCLSAATAHIGGTGG